MNENALKNRRILIKNAENGGIIADTRIARFDSLTNSAHISADSLADSINGILMQADYGCFRIGDSFVLNLKVEDGEMELSCEIVRIQNGSMLTDEEWYCKEILSICAN